MNLEFIQDLWDKDSIIDNELLQKMCSADNEDEFVSNTFKMANLKWKLIAYPNGNEMDSDGSFNLFLNLNSMTPEWTELYACCMLRCEQISAHMTDLRRYLNVLEGSEKLCIT